MVDEIVRKIYEEDQRCVFLRPLYVIFVIIITIIVFPFLIVPLLSPIARSETCHLSLFCFSCHPFPRLTFCFAIAFLMPSLHDDLILKNR